MPHVVTDADDEALVEPEALSDCELHALAENVWHCDVEAVELRDVVTLILSDAVRHKEEEDESVADADPDAQPERDDEGHALELAGGVAEARSDVDTLPEPLAHAEAEADPLGDDDELARGVGECAGDCVAAAGVDEPAKDAEGGDEPVARTDPDAFADDDGDGVELAQGEPDADADSVDDALGGGEPDAAAGVTEVTAEADGAELDTRGEHDALADAERLAQPLALAVGAAAVAEPATTVVEAATLALAHCDCEDDVLTEVLPLDEADARVLCVVEAEPADDALACGDALARADALALDDSVPWHAAMAISLL